MWWKKSKPITFWSLKTINPHSLRNSPSWRRPSRAFFFPPDITLDQGHGRHETREVYPFEVTPEQTGFPYSVQAAVILRTTHHLKTVRVTEETEIVFSSRPASKMSAADIQAFRRGHWGIENQLHYVRDVTFGEDASTVATGHAPQNLATLRNLVIGLCALDAARQHKQTSYLPRFRTAANNNRQTVIDLLSRPLLNGS
jgi:predicted transposase YbfD/YdcC